MQIHIALHLRSPAPELTNFHKRNGGTRTEHLTNGNPDNPTNRLISQELKIHALQKVQDSWFSPILGLPSLFHRVPMVVLSPVLNHVWPSFVEAVFCELCAAFTTLVLYSWLEAQDRPWY